MSHICPCCSDDVAVPYDFGAYRCLACGAVFSPFDDIADDPRPGEDCFLFGVEDEDQ